MYQAGGGFGGGGSPPQGPPPSVGYGGGGNPPQGPSFGGGVFFPEDPPSGGGFGGEGFPSYHPLGGPPQGPPFVGHFGGGWFPLVGPPLGGNKFAPQEPPYECPRGGGFPYEGFQSSLYPMQPRLPFLATLNFPDLTKLMNDLVFHDLNWPPVPTNLTSNTPKFEEKMGEYPEDHVTTFHL